MLPVSNDPLNDDEIDWLETFLLDRIDEETDTRDLDEGIFCISELDGLLTAVVSGPVMLPPSRWLPNVWGDFEPEFESEKMFARVFSLMTRHLNNIATLLMHQPRDYEPMFLEREVKGKTYTIVDEWCEGYMRGIHLAPTQWNLDSPEMKVLLAPIAAFHGQQGFATHDCFDRKEIGKLQDAIIPNVREIHAYWLAKRSKPALSEPIRHVNSKVGRNDPCPCGSGKKFKKCCLH